MKNFPSGALIDCQCGTGAGEKLGESRCKEAKFALNTCNLLGNSVSDRAVRVVARVKFRY